MPELWTALRVAISCASTRYPYGTARYCASAVLSSYARSSTQESCRHRQSSTAHRWQFLIGHSGLLLVLHDTPLWWRSCIHTTLSSEGLWTQCEVSSLWGRTPYKLSARRNVKGAAAIAMWALEKTRTRFRTQLQDQSQDLGGHRLHSLVADTLQMPLFRSHSIKPLDELFDMAGFLGGMGRSSRLFLQRLTSTQMFWVMIQQWSAASAAHAPLTFFEECAIVMQSRRAGAVVPGRGDATTPCFVSDRER